MSVAHLTSLLRFLARLAFQDTQALYNVLDAIPAKLGVPDVKYTLLSNFYDFVKVKYFLIVCLIIKKEETVYSSYYVKKHFCFYAFAILSSHLKELEENEGINFNKLGLANTNLFQSDFKALLQVFCRCLSEIYGYDSNQLEFIEPEIYANLTVMAQNDDYLIGNEFNLDSYGYLMKVNLSDFLLV